MGIFNRRRRPQARDKPTPADSRLLRMGRTADWRANSSEAICAAAARMARTLASCPMHLYKAEEAQLGDYLDRLVSYSPGPGWNSYTFVHDMEFSRNAAGWAYALILRDELSQPSQFVYLDAGRVTTLKAVETGDIWHRITMEDGKMGYVPDADMLALPFLSTSGGVTPASALGGTLQYDAEIKAFSLKQLSGVNDVILINVPGSLGQERRKNLIDDILDGYKASGKNALVLDSGVTATHLASSPVDPQVMAVDKITKSRTAGVYGMPSHLLGDGESSRASSEEEMQEFLSLAIVPAMALWEAEFNKKLLSYDKVCKQYHFAFDDEALSRANTAVLADKHFKAVRGGWMQVNEVRKREHLPPDKNGNTLVISRDLLPLDLIVNRPEELLQSGRGKTNSEGLGG